MYGHSWYEGMSGYEVILGVRGMSEVRWHEGVRRDVRGTMVRGGTRDAGGTRDVGGTRVRGDVGGTKSAGVTPLL